VTIPLWCLLGFVAWTLLLVLCVVSWRTTLVLIGRKRANAFTGGVQHGSELYWRFNRAHLNAVENLPLITAVVAAATFCSCAIAHVRHVVRSASGRAIIQTICHLVSNAVAVVYVRFTALLVQIGCLIWMIREIIAHV